MSIIAGRVIGRFLLVAWLVTSLGIAYTGWRLRRVDEIPVIALSELPNHRGERVRVQGTITESFALPNGELVALQAVSVWRRNTRASGTAASTATETHAYDRVWPEEVRLSDGTAQVPVVTAGAQPRYVTRLLQTNVTNGAVDPASARQITPQLMPIITGSVQVHAVRPDERVDVVGTVELRDGVPVIRTAATTPLIISNLGGAGLASEARWSSALRLALGATLFLFGLTIWQWLRAGYRRQIDGVAIYPVEVQAAQSASSKRDLQRKLDQLLIAAGVDTAKYQQQRRRAKRTALAMLLACPVLFIVSLVLLT